MGTRESRVEKRTDLFGCTLIRISVVGITWTTDPGHHINVFCGRPYGPRPVYSSARVDFDDRYVNIDEESVCLQINDNSGKKFFPHLVSYSINPAFHEGLMVLYDVTDEHSFEEAKDLVTDVDMRHKKVNVRQKKFLSLSLSLRWTV